MDLFSCGSHLRTLFLSNKFGLTQVNEEPEMQAGAAAMQ
jgi:hypothetical protein